MTLTLGQQRTKLTLDICATMLFWIADKARSSSFCRDIADIKFK